MKAKVGIARRKSLENRILFKQVYLEIMAAQIREG